MISDFVPITVIFSPFRTAGPSCPPIPGARSTTLPFWRYKLRTSPPGSALKARTREDCVTTGNCCGVDAGAAAVSGETAGGVDGAGVGLCANATELSAIPRAVSFREDGMYIGNTSIRHRASRVPFLQMTQVLQSLTFWRMIDVRSPPNRPQFAHLLC